MVSVKLRAAAMAILAGIACAAVMLMVPVALIERVIVASGLASVLAEAQPPLGATARILLAGAAGFGAMLCVGLAGGIAIARRPARPAQRKAPRSAIEDGAADRPIVRPIYAQSDLGAPFNSIRAESDPVPTGDEPALWAPDPWFDAIEDAVAPAPAAALPSLSDLVSRLEAGMQRRRNPPPAQPSAPMPDMDEALRDALGTLQRLTARSH